MLQAITNISKQFFTLDQEIYLDNNATTKMQPNTISALSDWYNVGNLSSLSPKSITALKVLDQLRYNISNHCGAPLDEYNIIFTSGGSEANATIWRHMIAEYKYPNIITSNIEHDSINKLISNYNEQLHVTKIGLHTQGELYGLVNFEELELALQHAQSTNNIVNMISIMTANNETGIINNMYMLCELAKKYHIKCVHTDAVQYLPKFTINMKRLNLHALSMSFHKMHALSGVGALIVHKSIKLNPLISGSQNNSLRGGTENVLGLASAYYATISVWHNRAQNNGILVAKIGKLINLLNTSCEKAAKQYNYQWNGIIHNTTYDVKKRRGTNIENRPGEYLVLITPVGSKDAMPHVLYFAIASSAMDICNIKIQLQLASKNIFISIGSACKKGEESHVLNSLNIDSCMRNAVFRVSISDYTTLGDLGKFAYEFAQILYKK